MSDGDSIARSIWIVLVLAMVGSSLMARRVPMARLMAMVAGWIVIFLGVYLLFGWLEPQFAAWQQSQRGGTVISAPASPVSSAVQNPVVASGASITVPMREDGHYWVDSSINGQSVRFLIDSGASITALSRATADSLGLPPDPMGRQVVMQTANGPVTADRSEIAAMAIGSIQASELPVVVSPAFGEVNVLGMNFLNKLKSWRVEDGQMILQPR